MFKNIYIILKICKKIKNKNYIFFIIKIYK